MVWVFWLQFWFLVLQTGFTLLDVVFRSRGSLPISPHDPSSVLLGLLFYGVTLGVGVSGRLQTYQQMMIVLIWVFGYYGIVPGLAGFKDIKRIAATYRSIPWYTAGVVLLVLGHVGNVVGAVGFVR